MKIFKKISGIILSVALLLSMGTTKMMVSAEGGTDPAEVRWKAAQRVREEIELAISMASMRAYISGNEKGKVKLDGRLLGVDTLSYNEMLLLYLCNVDAEFSFDYNGYHYVITIPSEKVVINNDILWYGPMYLMSLYWETAIVTPLELETK